MEKAQFGAILVELIGLHRLTYQKGEGTYTLLRDMRDSSMLIIETHWAMFEFSSIYPNSKIKLICESKGEESSQSHLAISISLEQRVVFWLPSQNCVHPTKLT